MIEQSFRLIPFPAPHIPAISLTGKCSLHDNYLDLHYSLAGNIEEILLPPPSPSPSRKDELWKETCFELFLAIKGQPGYWEFNLAPCGDWNVYRMDAYRRTGFREETAISQLHFEFKRESDACSLDVSVDLASLIYPQQELQMAITAIIQTMAGIETYWALTHPAPYADFHLREGFILGLAGQTHPSEQPAPDGLSSSTPDRLPPPHPIPLRKEDSQVVGSPGSIYSA